MNNEKTGTNQDFEIIRKIIFRKIHLYGQTKVSYAHKGYKQAAVLVPIMTVDQIPAICLTERSQQVDHHKGQISFPGGMVDKTDRTIEETALRETHEEIGIPECDIEIIGKLDDVYSITGYLIHPIIAEIKTLNNLKINRQEVKNIFFIPLKWILEDKNRRMDNYLDINGMIRKVWFFSEYQGKIIWGITASILVQLADLINK